MGTYGGISKLYKVRRTKTEHSDVATYGGISKIYIIHISIYLFFRFTDKVRGTKLKTLMWLRMAGEFMSIYILWYDLNSQLWLRMAVYRNYLSSIYVLISSFVSLTKYAGRKLNTLMWLRMAGEFISTYIHAYVYLANVSSID